MEKSELKRIFKDTVPIMIGYLVLGIGFGVIMATKGYNFWLAPIMSIFIYAGSMQYAAVGLFTGGAGMLTVALSTLAINARHLFYGISMIDKYSNAGKKKPYLIFGLTDETYSIVSHTDEDVDYCFFVTLFNHAYWVMGTLTGSIIGNMISFDARGLDFSLTAFFLVVFTDQWLKSKKHLPAIIGVATAVICLLIYGSDKFLIPTMIEIALLLYLFERREERKNG